MAINKRNRPYCLNKGLVFSGEELGAGEAGRGGEPNRLFDLKLVQNNSMRAPECMTSQHGD